MIFKVKYLGDDEQWEEIPDEELWEDGELQWNEVMDKINYHVLKEGDWTLIRRINNG